MHVPPCYTQILSSDVDHSGPSVLLFVDMKDGGRFLFIAGEGLQRMFREYKLRISKVVGGSHRHPTSPLCAPSSRLHLGRHAWHVHVHVPPAHTRT